MAKERVSLHQGKSGNAKHNEHNFYESGKDVSIIPAVKGMSLEQGEIEIYKRRYSKALDEQNERYKKKGNYSRIKTMEEFYNSKRFMPTETILQFGNMDSEIIPDSQNFNEMTREYFGWLKGWSECHGNHLQVLDLATHFDETTPHAHLRFIWDYEDENGAICVGQEKGMEQAGLELPEPNKPVSRYNNRNMTFTAMCREKWQDILEKHGFEVEREPLPGKKKHETVKQFHDRKDRELKERESVLDVRENGLNERENELKRREINIDARENRLRERKDRLNARENELKEREAGLNARENELLQREQKQKNSRRDGFLEQFGLEEQTNIRRDGILKQYGL